MQEKTSRTFMLAVLYAAAFIAAFNENIVNVALVDIMAEFSISSVAAQWLVTGYMIVTAVVVVSMAFLMQRFTMRQLFFAGAACFIVGEAACFRVPAFPLVLGARLLQAVGSGLFIPPMMNGVLGLAPRDKMGAYLSIGSAAITLGPAFAPVLSGIAVTMFGWRAIFAVPTSVVVLILMGGAFCVKDLSEAQAVKMDWISLVLIAAGLFLFVYGMGQLGSAVLVGIGALAAGCALVVLFGRRQMRLTQPLLNVDPIVGNWRFIVACALVVVAMMTSFSMSVLLPLYFEQAFGLEAITAGGLVLPAITVNALTAIAGGRIMDARGSWPLLPVGFLLVMAGQAGIALASPLLELIPVVAASVVVYAGVGLVMAPSQTAGLKTLEPSLHPDGVSILNTLVMIAASFGPSLFVGIMATVEADAAAIGVSAGQAAASGFSSAVAVAAGIALVGFALALAFAWRERSSAWRTARMDDSSMKGLQSC